ncbi:hypothetical protein Q7P37_003873 [Cladosporium fusiforme]
MPSSEYPPYPSSHSPPPFTSGGGGGDDRNRHVHFPDTFTPSSFSMRIKLGPRDSPSNVIKISISFEPGRFPRIKVRTKRPGESRRRRRRRF